MSIVFACLPEALKPKVKETFPEITFLTSELDESVHGKPRKKREKKKVSVEAKHDSVSPL